MVDFSLCSLGTNGLSSFINQNYRIKAYQKRIQQFLNTFSFNYLALSLALTLNGKNEFLVAIAIKISAKIFHVSLFMNKCITHALGEHEYMMNIIILHQLSRLSGLSADNSEMNGKNILAMKLCFCTFKIYQQEI